MANTSHAGHGGAGSPIMPMDVGAIGNGTTEHGEMLWLNSELLEVTKWIDTTDIAGTTVLNNLMNIRNNINRVANWLSTNISNHMNAFNRKATGVEVWYYLGDAKGKALAEKLSAAIANALGLPNRGAKATTDLYIIRETVGTTVLIEWAFIDNADDMKKWNANKVKAVDAALKVLGFKGGNANMKPTYYKQKNCYYKITEKACTIYKEPEMKTKYYGIYARDSIIWVSDVKEIWKNVFAGKTPGGWISLNSKYVTDRV
ncbi:hypothetical protein CBF34_07000 [Vagococcus penaei]|uniref:N-acetylmuramoyl-L-alanine amidase n=1 Tax=Vagococcus penaei TaxID=633807 RepID=UPI000F868F0A|nr:N-acetylmuramoyl-L-alanine amidase [Vagococcus penaei]RSU01401.1 hypothetical protein CBF34_07000 [Vagococcus penaei]